MDPEVGDQGAGRNKHQWGPIRDASRFGQPGSPGLAAPERPIREHPLLKWAIPLPNLPERESDPSAVIRETLGCFTQDLSVGASVQPLESDL